MSNYIKKNNEWVQALAYYQKVNGAWVLISESDFENYINTTSYRYGGEPVVPLIHTLVIGGTANVSGISCSYSAIYDNQLDYRNNLILRRAFYSPPKGKKLRLNEYIIWYNEENIRRFRKTKNIFVDGTFHHPPGFAQLLIIMYKDIIKEIKIPAFYIHSKKEF